MQEATASRKAFGRTSGWREAVAGGQHDENETEEGKSRRVDCSWSSSCQKEDKGKKIVLLSNNGKNEGERIRANVVLWAAINATEN